MKLGSKKSNTDMSLTLVLLLEFHAQPEARGFTSAVPCSSGVAQPSHCWQPTARRQRRARDGSGPFLPCLYKVPQNGIGDWGAGGLKDYPSKAVRAAQWREHGVTGPTYVLRISEASSRCFDLLGGSWEVLTHTVLEDDRLVLVWHTSVHHRAVPVALHMRLDSPAFKTLPCTP